MSVVSRFSLGSKIEGITTLLHILTQTEDLELFIHCLQEVISYLNKVSISIQTQTMPDKLPLVIFCNILVYLPSANYLRNVCTYWRHLLAQPIARKIV